MKSTSMPPAPCRCVALALLIGLPGLAGCGDARVGADLQIRPKPRELKTAEQRLTVPADEPFAIAIPRDSREPGLDGEAEAKASADRRGAAQATASVTTSGQAEAVFQLGHAVKNATSRQADVTVTAQFSYELEAELETTSGLPECQIGLKLYVRDDRGRLLREIALLDYSTENGPVMQQANEEVSFTVTLGPSNAAHVFLAGHVQVDIREDNHASGTLSLSSIAMSFVTTPAPAVTAVPAEAP